MKEEAEVFDIITEMVNGDKDKADKMFAFFTARSTAKIDDLKHIFLTKDDMLQIMNRIDALKTEVNNNLWKLLGGIAVLLAIYGFLTGKR